MSPEQTSNPYARFLGLPESVTQPDYYELLGIDRFTEDPRAIKAAAAAQNEKLRIWQNNDELYQQVRQVEMEVATAMITLADPTKRQAYNESLSPSVPETEIIEEIEEEAVTLEEPFERIVFPEEVSAVQPPRSRPSQKKTPQPDVELGLGCGWSLGPASDSVGNVPSSAYSSSETRTALGSL